jgi:hypothetical protein
MRHWITCGKLGGTHHDAVAIENKRIYEGQSFRAVLFRSIASSYFVPPVRPRGKWRAAKIVVDALVFEATCDCCLRMDSYARQSPQHEAESNTPTPDR